MKYFFLIFLVVILLEGCNAVAQSTASVQQAPAGLINSGGVPICAVSPTYTPAATVTSSNSSQTEKTVLNSCIVDLPKALYSSSYCSNPTANWGGVNITIPPLGQNGYLTYPKNCTLQKSKTGDNHVLLCNGLSGSSVTITVTNTCQPPAAMLPDLAPSCPKPFYAVPKNGGQYCAFTGFQVPTPSPVQPSCPAGYQPAYKNNKVCKAIENSNPVQSVPVVCPANYSMDKYGSCVWSPPKCSAGYEFSPSKNCCQPAPAYPPIKACPEGYSVVNGMCKSDSRSVQYSESKVFTFTEGVCKKPLPSDKPALVNPTPTICLDPAGGCP